MIREDIQTRKLADGSQLSIPVFSFTGRDPSAPSAYIQSSVHASEVQGYLVCLQLIDYFIENPPEGNVTIVPIANPYGLNCKLGEYTLGRFDPVTGDNWNRNYVDLSYLVENFLNINRGPSFKDLVPMFKKSLYQDLQDKLQNPASYHKKLALELQSLAISADVVLDLHCDTISLPHVYAANYAMESVSSLGINFVIEIPELFAGALDEAIFCPWLALVKQYNSLNNTQITHPSIEAFTVELGNQEQINKKDAEQQTNNILNYLNKKRICQAKNTLSDSVVNSCKLADFITIYAPIGGLTTDAATLGSLIKAGDNLMTLSSPSLFEGLTDDFVNKSSSKISIEKDSIPITKMSSAIIHEGMALMKVMTNYKVINEKYNEDQEIIAKLRH